MMSQRLERFMTSRRATLLGVGPMSQNCVDGAIELANDHEIPLMLIASRRQIECEEMGGGYVNNWSTEAFAKYVTERDRKGKIILARDHGGPWQNPAEVLAKCSLRNAMESAKNSYEVDIASGFQLIHIDPSVDIHGSPSVADILERVYELYEHCWSTAKSLRKDIIFEIGTEEQSGGTNSVEELELVLKDISAFCQRNTLPRPSFVVMQTGTRVMETRNVGSFDAPFRISDELPAEIQVPRMLELCQKYGIYMKEHNTDYLSDEALSWHPKLGIHAANVAPEFGVTETRAFIELLRSKGLENLLMRFLELSYNSKKWLKWMVPDTTASDFDRSVIAGHYVFSTPEFREIKAQAEAESKMNVDTYLKEHVKTCITRYLRNFKLLEKI
jgi:D-tagatose-1,6-bisphosphate aldolase subunit GatZ/KbaZ-like